MKIDIHFWGVLQDFDNTEWWDLTLIYRETLKNFATKEN